MKLDATAASLEALGNSTRLRICEVLVGAGRTGMSVGTLQARLAIPGSTLNHHLGKLIAAGIVTQERKATTLTCRVDDAVLRSLVHDLAGLCSGGSTTTEGGARDNRAR